jgi:ATP-dependent Clp protease adaptor protein ClpS
VIEQETMSEDVQTTQSVKEQTERKVKRPRLYNVLLHNDDYTTMEFVVMILMTVFHRPEADAIRIMLHVHTRGVGVAGVYPRQMAETRVNKVTRLAREYEYPLRCSMEPA